MLLDILCKAGKLQVSEDGILRVQAPFNKTVWQVPCNTVTKLTTQPSTLGALTVFVHTTSTTYQVETVGQRNFPKIQALFPHVPVQSEGKASHWYQDIMKRTHVETYTNQKVMQKEVEQASQHGWIPQTSAGISGHRNLGKIVAGGILLGGVGALAGSGRSKDKITVTFVRTPEWLEANR